MTANGEAGFALLLTSELFGRGDDVLGAKLMDSFLDVIGGPSRTPTVVAMVNSASKLACEGSPVLDHLHALEQSGCRILVCTTCLNFFGIKATLKVGEASTMPEIVDSMLAEGKVVTL